MWYCPSLYIQGRGIDPWTPHDLLDDCGAELGVLLLMYIIALGRSIFGEHIGCLMNPF
jgi:hypothetical protein